LKKLLTVKSKVAINAFNRLNGLFWCFSSTDLKVTDLKKVVEERITAVTFGKKFMINN